MQCSTWFIFWNIILYCKIIITFLELFSATCFLYILETNLTRRNTSIPKSLKKRQHMTFILTSSNDDRSGICQFFIKTYSILSMQYMYKISCKMDKYFLRYSMFFHCGTSRPPNTPDIFKKDQPR